MTSEANATDSAPRSARAVAQRLENAIDAGELAPWAPLPSIRELAGDLGLSPATVAEAYRLLRRRGLIRTDPRRGSRVLPRAVAAATSASSVPGGARDLASGNPDPLLLPKLEAALLEPPERPALYGDPPLLGELQTELARHFARDGLPAETLVATNGALDAIARLLETALVAGDRVAVEDPGYAVLLDLVRARGYEPIPVPVDETGPDPGALARAGGLGAAAFILTPRAQNPRGAAVDAARAAELRAALERFPQLLVIEDDHAAAVAGASYEPVTSNCPRRAVVRSFAKSHGPDLRIAVVAADPETTERLQTNVALTFGWVSGIMQRLLVRLLRSSSAERQVRRAEGAYAERRVALVAALRERDVPAHGASGFNVWIPVRDEDAAARALLERGWAVRAGTPHRLRTAPGIRVTTSTLLPDEAEAFAGDVATVLRPRPTRTA